MTLKGEREREGVSSLIADYLRHLDLLDHFLVLVYYVCALYH